MAVQSYIVPKKRGRTGAKAAAKARGGKAYTTRKTSTSVRVRQRPPSDFVAGSFRTVNTGGGVKAVVGKLKAGKKKRKR